MDEEKADKGTGAPRRFYLWISSRFNDAWKRVRKSDTDTGEDKTGNSGRKRNLFIAALIALLVVGYLPFSRFLFKPTIVNYTLDTAVVTEYEGEGAPRTGPADIGVVSLEKGKPEVIPGIIMEKEYLEIACGYQGADAGSISFIMDFLSRPKELWANVRIPGGETFSLPLYVSRLEEEDWHVVESCGLAIYDKEGRFSDLEQLARFAVESRENVGLVGCLRSDVILMLEGRARSKETELLTAPLRGPHSLELLVSNNRLVVEISKRDLNLNMGEENVPVTLFKEEGEVYSFMLEEEVYSCVLEDDGSIIDDGCISEEPVVERLEIDGLENGVYRLQIAIQEDEFQDYMLDSIVTSAPSAAFLNMVHVYDTPATGAKGSRALEVYLESAPAELKAWTGIDEIAEKSVSINGAETITLTPESSDGFAAVGERGVDELSIVNTGDIVLRVDDGYFSFLPETLFDPVYPLLGTVKGGEQWDCSYFLVGDYAHPVIDEESGTFRVDFQFLDVDIPDGKFELVLMHISDDPLVLYSLLIRLE